MRPLWAETSSHGINGNRFAWICSKATAWRLPLAGSSAVFGPPLQALIAASANSSRSNRVRPALGLRQPRWMTGCRLRCRCKWLVNRGQRNMMCKNSFFQGRRARRTAGQPKQSRTDERLHYLAAAVHSLMVLIRFHIHAARRRWLVTLMHRLVIRV